MTTPQTGFNLVDDPWIELGDSVVSIREALVRGDELPGWPSGEPLFASVLIRLLLPIVYRTTGMDTAGLTGRQFASRQRRLLASGRLDRDAVNGYLTGHRDRFWLTVPPLEFAPFAQDPTLSTVEPVPIAKLVATWASGNNPTLGPHAPVGDIHIASAARWLLIMHGYKSGGMHTARKPGKGPVSLRASRLRGTMSLHPVGPTFAQTLLHHLVPAADGYELGAPFWEKPPPANPTAAPLSRAGLLEQLAGRHDKAILLSPTPSGRIAGVVISEGTGRVRGLEYPDPYLVITAGHEPLRPRAGRDAWRDIDTLVIHSEGVKPADLLQARILSWCQNNNRADIEPERWAIVAHRPDQDRERGWGISNLPDLVGLFPPGTAAASTATALIEAAEEASSMVGKQLSALAHATGHSSPRYTAARAEFWPLTERTFWAAVTAESPDPTAGASWWDELRRNALAGFDAATRHLTQIPRTHMDVEQYRERIDRWRRPKPTSRSSQHKET